MKNAVFYHAGCPVCVSAENQVLAMIDRSKYNVEVVHLGEQKNRVDEAQRKGVQSVPALVIGPDVLHINFGASLKDLK
jgi:hypothetical protein